MAIFFSFSAAYGIWVQYWALDNLQGAFYDLIERIKVGHWCRFYNTTQQCSGGQYNVRAPASPAVNTSALYLWKWGF